jgi:hypothetical protein
MKHTLSIQSKMTPSGPVLSVLPGCGKVKFCADDGARSAVSMTSQALDRGTMESGSWGEPLKKANSSESLSWLPDMDLNHDKQIQSLLCYRYTIGQSIGRPR